MVKFECEASVIEVWGILYDGGMRVMAIEIMEEFMFTDIIEIHLPFVTPVKGTVFLIRDSRLLKIHKL